MLKVSSLAVVIFSITLLSSAKDKEIEEVRKVREKAKYEMMLKSQEKTNNSSEINVSGIIVDGNGNQLDDVELDLEFSKLKGWETEDFKTKIVSKSKFTISQRGYTSLAVSFKRKGYMAEKRFYTVLRSSKYAKKTTFSMSDEKIVLRAIGKLAKVKKIKKLLEYNWKNKKATFFNMSTMSTETLPVNDPIKAKKYIYIDFERDKDGIVLTARGRLGNQVPKNFVIKYVSNDKTDGFKVEGNKKDFTYLQEAPASIYNEKEIILPFESNVILY